MKTPTLLKKNYWTFGDKLAREREKNLPLCLFMIFLCQFYIDIKYGSVLKDITHQTYYRMHISMVKHCKASNESHQGEKKRQVLDRRESNQS